MQTKTLFIKRFIKYSLLLGIVCAMMVTIVFNYYQQSYNEILDNSKTSLHIVDIFVEQSVQEESFFLIIQDNEIIMSSNFNSETEFNPNSDTYHLNGTQYTLLEDINEDAGLRFVLGISQSILGNQIDNSTQVIIIISAIVWVVIVLYCVLMSLKEARSFKMIIDSTKHFNFNTELITTKNEFNYVNQIFNKSREKIEELNTTLQNSMLHKILLNGIDSQREKQLFISNSKLDFEIFCIAILKFEDYDEDKANIDAHTILEIESSIRSCLDYDSASLYINPMEIVLFIFTKNSDDKELKGIQGKLSVAISDVNSVNMNIGFSKIAGGAENIRSLYLQAKNAFDIYHIEGKNSVFVFENEVDKSYNSFDSSVFSKIQEAIFDSDSAILAEIMGNIRKYISSNIQNSQEILQVLFSLRQQNIRSQ